MSESTDHRSIEGTVFDIQRYSVHDGPGIRTTVFLKGCPLSCLWCHNPESQRIQPVLSFEKDICILCGECVKACPRNVHSIVNGDHIIHRELCISCGGCVEACNTNALVLKGQTMTVEEVLGEALRDELLYRKSGGGVTASGGEPLLQPEFTYGLLQSVKEYDINTAIETSGYAQWSELEMILEVTDLVIYDVKHMDSSQHKKFIRVGNELILENLGKLVSLEKDVLVRIPLIPGINDMDDNLTKSAEFLKKLGIERVEFIPYHEFASDKNVLIGRDYALLGLEPYTSEQLEEKTRIMEKHGVQAKIGV